MKFALFLIACLVTLSSATAQWVDAKLVLTNSSDTLKGKARFEYDTIAFKSADGKRMNYNPTHLKLAYLGNETFASSEYLKLPGTSPSNFFFVKVLSQGDIQLFYKDDDPKNENSQPSFFISKKDSTIIELIRLEKKVFKDGIWYTNSYDAYKNQLKNLFKDCSSTIIDDKKNFYAEGPMMKVVEQYAKCRNYNLQVKTIERRKAVTYVLGGVDYTSVTFASDQYSFQFLNNASASSVMPFVGFRGELPLKRAAEASFVTEAVLKFTSLSFSGSKLSVLHFKLNLGFEKNFRLGAKSKLALQAGLSLNKPISSSFSNSNDPRASFAFKSFDLGFWYGAGINFDRMGFFVRNENFMNGGFSAYYNVTMTGSYLYAGMKYRLSK